MTVGVRAMTAPSRGVTVDPERGDSRSLGAVTVVRAVTVCRRVSGSGTCACTASPTRRRASRARKRTATRNGTGRSPHPAPPSPPASGALAVQARSCRRRSRSSRSLRRRRFTRITARASSWRVSTVHEAISFSTCAGVRPIVRPNWTCWTSRRRQRSRRVRAEKPVRAATSAREWTHGGRAPGVLFEGSMTSSRPRRAGRWWSKSRALTCKDAPWRHEWGFTALSIRRPGSGLVPGRHQPAPTSPERHDARNGSTVTALRPSQSHYRNTLIRLPDLAVTEDVLTGLTFENCELVGPAVIVPLSTTIQGCSWDGSPEGIFWVIPDDRTSVIGAIGLQDCHLVGCRIRQVGLAVPESSADDFRRGFGF